MRDYVAGPWFLFSNFISENQGDEELPDSILRDQSLVAKRLMESQGLEEWQEWVTDQRNCVLERETEHSKGKLYKIIYLSLTVEKNNEYNKPYFF